MNMDEKLTRQAGPRNDRRFGFTLVELLIVVVLLGVLASLVIPRLIGQVDRAQTAEAYEKLDILRRAVLRYLDERGGGSNIGSFGVAQSNNPNDPISNPNELWRAMGMEPLPSNSHFQYDCGAPSELDPTLPPFPYCRATSVSDATKTIAIALATGQYHCGGGYTQDPNTGQCS